MMGHKSAQMEMLLFNPEELIPTNHQLRRIDRLISFGFVYDLFKDKYSEIGKPSIDPVCLIKMLLIGYLYGIKSERRLTEEVSLNNANRWFCGFGIAEKMPDYSTFTKTADYGGIAAISLKICSHRSFGNARRNA